MEDGLKRFLCRVATTFGPSGALDEVAFRAHLTRFVENGIGVFLGSTGSGEGGSLTHDELDRVYRIGIEVCKGNVPTNSNQPERFTATDTLEQARIAMAAGVDALNIYGPNGLHGYAATEREYLRYFDRVLGEIDYPVTLCPNPAIGYAPEPATIADIADRYQQVTAVVLSGRDLYEDSYFLKLRGYMRDGVGIYVNHPGSMNSLALGAAGLEGPYPNLIPKTCAAYLTSFERGDISEAARFYAEIRTFSAFAQRWHGATPRVFKAAMRVFKLPGWEGGLREPYLMLPDPDFSRFSEELLNLDIEEIRNMAGSVA